MNKLRELPFEPQINSRGESWLAGDHASYFPNTAFEAGTPWMVQRQIRSNGKRLMLSVHAPNYYLAFRFWWHGIQLMKAGMPQRIAEAVITEAIDFHMKHPYVIPVYCVKCVLSEMKEGARFYNP